MPCRRRILYGRIQPLSLFLYGFLFFSSIGKVDAGIHIALPQTTYAVNSLLSVEWARLGTDPTSFNIQLYWDKDDTAVNGYYIPVTTTANQYSGKTDSYQVPSSLPLGSYHWEVIVDDSHGQQLYVASTPSYTVVAADSSGGGSSSGGSSGSGGSGSGGTSSGGSNGGGSNGGGAGGDSHSSVISNSDTTSSTTTTHTTSQSLSSTTTSSTFSTTTLATSSSSTSSSPVALATADNHVNTSSTSGSTSKAAHIGGAIAGAVVIALIIAVIVLLWCRRRRRNRQSLLLTQPIHQPSLAIPPSSPTLVHPPQANQTYGYSGFSEKQLTPLRPNHFYSDSADVTGSRRSVSSPSLTAISLLAHPPSLPTRRPENPEMSQASASEVTSESGMRVLMHTDSGVQLLVGRVNDDGVVVAA